MLELPPPDLGLDDSDFPVYALLSPLPLAPDLSFPEDEAPCPFAEDAEDPAADFLLPDELFSPLAVDDEELDAVDRRAESFPLPP